MVCIIASRVNERNVRLSQTQGRTIIKTWQAQAVSHCPVIQCVLQCTLHSQDPLDNNDKITAQQCILVALILPIFACSFWSAAHNGPHLAS